MEDTIRKYALQNAIKFDGKANMGAVIGKVLSSNPELKKDMKSLSQQVAKIISEVNKFSVEEQTRQLQELAPKLLEKKEKEKKGLPELLNAVNGKVVTRIPPEPSKHMHIGHAFSFLINYLYAKKYNGKCVLRFEDTNPEKAEKEYYKSIEEDILWLKIAFDEKVIVSDRMPKYYELAQGMIEKGLAYVCFCSREKMSEYREKALICDCREESQGDNLQHWQKMLKGKYAEGECILRLKGQMDSWNTTMRDPVLFRIVKAKHTRQGKKYKVWPTYDFENPVEDELCGITHVLRSNEFGEFRIQLQDYLKELLGFRKPTVKQYARLNVAGATTKGREIREAIREGEYMGWDDPRLVTIKALRRRGFVPEMFHELAIEAGMSKTDSNLDWSIIHAINRKIIDPLANRYFFVENPQKVAIKNAPSLKVEAPLHPENKMKGVRKLKTGNTFFIADKLEENQTYRFMHLFNFKDKEFISKDLDQSLKAKLIHWLPEGQVLDAEVMMPDATVKKGLVEVNAKKIKVGDIVQLERFGFCRLDKKTKEKLSFWYTHG